jgi:hypothetical protein
MPRSRELQDRRKAAALRDAERARIESAIKAGSLAEIDLFFVQHSPAVEFILTRADTSDSLCDILDALLQTDIPLDRDARQIIRDEMRRLRFPSKRTARQEVERFAVASLEKYLAARGERAPRKLAAKALGLNSETLRKRRQRDNKK